MFSLSTMITAIFSPVNSPIADEITLDLNGLQLGDTVQDERGRVGELREIGENPYWTPEPDYTLYGYVVGYHADTNTTWADWLPIDTLTLVNDVFAAVRS